MTDRSQSQHVFHDGNLVLVQADVMKSLGLRQGQRVTTEQFYDCIAGNAESFFHDMELAQRNGADDTSDTELIANPPNDKPNSLQPMRKLWKLCSRLLSR